MDKDLMKFNPMHELNNMFKGFSMPNFSNFDKEFKNEMRSFGTGRVNVVNDKKAYKVAIQLPGFKKNNIHLDYRHNRLSINAKHTVNNQTKDEHGKVIRKEFNNSNVSRQFYLPNVVFNKITASYDGGILHINMPKAKSNQPDKHEIKIG